jgi:hypothetical protein
MGGARRTNLGGAAPVVGASLTITLPGVLMAFDSAFIADPSLAAD